MQEVGLVSEAQYAYPASEHDQGVAQTCSLGNHSSVTKIVAYEDVPATEGALMKVGEQNGNPARHHTTCDVPTPSCSGGLVHPVGWLASGAGNDTLYAHLNRDHT